MTTRVRVAFSRRPARSRNRRKCVETWTKARSSASSLYDNSLIVRESLSERHHAHQRPAGTAPGRGASTRYWITWSARPSSDGGIVRPSAIAVFILMTSSNLVSCCTGSSAGFVPVTIRSMYPAARRDLSTRLALAGFALKTWTAMFEHQGKLHRETAVNQRSTTAVSGIGRREGVW